MITITDSKAQEVFSKEYKVGNTEKEWCLHQSSPRSVQCSRDKGHSGPHRYRAAHLWLWYDEGHEAEEQVLEVCVRLGVIPK